MYLVFALILRTLILLLITLLIDHINLYYSHKVFIYIYIYLLHVLYLKVYQKTVYSICTTAGIFTDFAVSHEYIFIKLKNIVVIYCATVVIRL